MPEFDAENFASRVKQLRLERGMSRERFARVIHCTEPTIRRWELGRFLPTAYWVGQITQQFDVSADWLMGIQEERKDTT